MHYSNIVNLASLFFSVALAAPGTPLCDEHPCYTATVINEPVCPLYCEGHPDDPPCTSTVFSTKTVPPSGSCPTPTTTVDGKCNTICNACPTSIATTTGCFTHTVTQTTGPPVVCPLVACVNPTKPCTQTATVTTTPAPGCAGCFITETITTQVPSSCPPLECPTCTAQVTETVGWYA